MMPNTSPMLTGRLIDLMQSVRWQFELSPEEHLSVSEAERIWPIGSDRLMALFDTLVDVGFLQRVEHGVYRRRPNVADAG